jgi:hypothetical protein
MVFSFPQRFTQVNEWFLYDGTYWMNDVTFEGRCGGPDGHLTKFISDEEFKLKAKEFEKWFKEHPHSFMFKVMTEKTENEWGCFAEGQEWVG